MLIERKQLIRIELKTDGPPGSFIAKIAELDVMDKDGDVTLRGATPAGGKEVLISAYQHGSWQGALPVGKATMMEVDNEVQAEGQFNLDSETGREHYAMVKFSGNLQEWSYGFSVLAVGDEKALDSWAKDHEGARPSRIIKAYDPFEISPVLRGAGVETGTLAIKSTYTEQAETALDTIEALLTRTASLAELRRKDGRELNEPNRQRLQEVKAALTKAADAVDSLLAPATVTEDKTPLLSLLKTLQNIKEYTP